MADPVATARSTFLHSAPAEALFFHMGNHHATRVDCPTLGLEFTDNAWLGSDPEGTLFFNDAVDFSDTTETSKYKVTTQQYNGIVYAIITFYWDDIGSAYAQFVGEDPTTTVARAGMEGYTWTGLWTKLEIGSSSATVTKHSTDQKINLVAKAISLQAHWTGEAASFKPRTGVNVKGNLYFKNLKDLSSKGLIANYNNDRIVFYQGVHSYDFVGYFIPLEQNNGTLAFAGADDREFTGVTWSAF